MGFVLALMESKHDLSLNASCFCHTYNCLERANSLYAEFPTTLLGTVRIEAYMTGVKIFKTKVLWKYRVIPQKQLPRPSPPPHTHTVTRVHKTSNFMVGSCSDTFQTMNYRLQFDQPYFFNDRQIQSPCS